MHGVYEYLIQVITLLLGMVTLCMHLRTSALAGSMLRVNCPVFSPLAQSPLPPFSPLLTHTEHYEHRQHLHARIFFCRAE